MPFDTGVPDSAPEAPRASDRPQHALAQAGDLVFGADATSFASRAQSAALVVDAAAPGGFASLLEVLADSLTVQNVNVEALLHEVETNRLRDGELTGQHFAPASVLPVHLASVLPVSCGGTGEYSRGGNQIVRGGASGAELSTHPGVTAFAGGLALQVPVQFATESGGTLTVGASPAGALTVATAAGETSELSSTSQTSWPPAVTQLTAQIAGGTAEVSYSVADSDGDARFLYVSVFRDDDSQKTRTEVIQGAGDESFALDLAAGAAGALEVDTAGAQVVAVHAVADDSSGNVSVMKSLVFQTSGPSFDSAPAQSAAGGGSLALSWAARAADGTDAVDVAVFLSDASGPVDAVTALAEGRAASADAAEFTLTATSAGTPLSHTTVYHATVAVRDALNQTLSRQLEVRTLDDTPPVAAFEDAGLGLSWAASDRSGVSLVAVAETSNAWSGADAAALRDAQPFAVHLFSGPEAQSGAAALSNIESYRDTFVYATAFDNATDFFAASDRNSGLFTHVFSAPVVGLSPDYTATAEAGAVATPESAVTVDTSPASSVTCSLFLFGADTTVPATAAGMSGIVEGVDWFASQAAV